ncbi:hypothetical protein FNF27_06954 [Cafeteria roenbergensis]|uniref:peptidyl-tRNA hydrolase n=1 Tax=Cafeteria roenbergensis TaxID=33653 RepID=A0A5A8DVG2_CAFRO|nr:hypothetical protein FNF27_06954 [Cafeteria roenbergensis]
MDGPGAAVAALRANIERWDRGPLKVSIKPLPATSGGAVVPIVMRWSQPTPHQPVPEHYATITAAMRRQPDGKAWSAQYRLEHESYVYSDAEMARLCRKLVLRTVQAMARAAAAAAALDVIEPFEETRLERLRVARLRAELAAKTEQDASAVRMTGYLARKEDPIVQCIIVRKDLEWPLGALMAQACHASMAAVEENRHDEATTAYLHADNLLGMHKVVYEAKSETALQNAATKLRERGARFHAWVEQPEGIHTAIALKPYPRTVARVLCKGFRLLK